MTIQKDEIVFVGVGIMPGNGPQPTKEDAALFASLIKTAEGRQVLSYLQPAGPQMGTWKIFKKIGGAIKKIGAITRPFTTALAKTFIPSGVVNALAKADPTSGNKLKNMMAKALPAAQSAFTQITAPAPAAVVTKPGFFSPENRLRNILIAGGAAVVVVGGGFLLFRRPAVQTIKGE